MSFLNTLGWLPWMILAVVPLAIIALYFLKLRRQPLEVPSTYLWSRTIEDLRVNSLWQRLRQSLLLFLQLLLVALAILAILRPGWRGTELTGDRFIFMIDTSASMSATDIAPTRLEFAKQRVLKMIAQMKSGDVAMIVSFSDGIPRVEQPFTEMRNLLRQKVHRVRPTARRTDLSGALRTAAGLANPGRTRNAEDAGDLPVADPLPATVYIFSDGGFPPVADFSLGNLEPQYIRIGTQTPKNLGIAAFSADRNLDHPGVIQAFARIENYGSTKTTADVVLFLNDREVDASRITIPAAVVSGGARDSEQDEGSRRGEKRGDPEEEQGKRRQEREIQGEAGQGEAGQEERQFLQRIPGKSGVQFELRNIDEGALRVELRAEDDLVLDNKAYAVIGITRRARVLVVTPGNDALRLAATTEEAAKYADVTFVSPEEAADKKYRDLAVAGAFDLVVYDRTVPERMPQANTLFLGEVPPVEGWSRGEVVQQPMIIDTERAHPLTNLVEMGSVKFIYQGFAIKAPEGAQVLFDSHVGPLLVLSQRGGFEDAVLGFEILGKDDSGDVIPKTDWVGRRSFPVFVMNALRYLGGLSGTLAVSGAPPGTSLELRSHFPVDAISVTSPSGQESRVLREGQGKFSFSRTDELGVYQVREGDSTDVTQRFPVNLFNRRESDLVPAVDIYIEYETVEGQSGMNPVRRELWKLLILFGLGVLAFEWYVYNRRVYL